MQVVFVLGVVFALYPKLTKILITRLPSTLTERNKEDYQMKFKFLIASFAGLLLSVSSIAHAGLITKYYVADLTSENTTLLSVGDTITWSVTFDDTSLVMNQYDDGLDGVAGTSDDFSNATFTTTPTSSYNIYANATFDFQSLIAASNNEIAILTGLYADINQFNRSWYFARTNGTQNQMTTFYDDITFDAADFPTTLGGGTGSFKHYYRNNLNNLLSINLNFNKVREVVQTVPEPSTLAIFALGMIGLASRRFKKQS